MYHRSKITIERQGRPSIYYLVQLPVRCADAKAERTRLGLGARVALDPTARWDAAPLIIAASILPPDNHGAPSKDTPVSLHSMLQSFLPRPP